MLTTKTLLNLFYKVLCFVTQSLAKTRLFKTIMIKVGFNFVNANKIHGHGTCYIKTLIMTSYRNSRQDAERVKLSRPSDVKDQDNCSSREETLSLDRRIYISIALHFSAGLQEYCFVNQFNFIY